MHVSTNKVVGSAALRSPIHCLLAAIILNTIGLVPVTVGAQTANTDEIDNTTSKAPLDGRVFIGALGPEGKPKDVEDRFVFDNGTFVSKECELRCDYPARPYFVRQVGERIEFLSETKCPYKDATIVWRGAVEDDRIKGVATWTIDRWYWTIERKYEFSGKLRQSVAPLARAD